MAGHDIDRLRNAMRAAEAAMDRGTGTRGTWTTASADLYVALYPDDAKRRPSGVAEGIPSVDEIRDRAAIADRANKAIPRSGRIDPDPERHDEWSARLGWAEETLGAVFTDTFFAAAAALKVGDPRGLEYSVRFLEADPWCHRSGYWKARLIPKIVQLELDEAQRQRLRQVVLAVVADPRRRREIKRYGTLARAVATDSLRARLDQLANAADPQIRFNAHQVLAWLD